MEVQTKELIIKKREEEKGNLKAAIEIQRAEQDFDFSKLRKQLDDQKSLIAN